MKIIRSIDSTSTRDSIKSIGAFVLCTLIILTLGCETGQKRGSKVALIQEAHADMEFGNYKSALTKIQNYIMAPWGDKQDEDLALMIAATSAAKLGRPGEAIGYVSRLRKKFPDSPYNNAQLEQIESLSRVALNTMVKEREEQQKKLLADIELAEKRVKESPQDSNAFVNLGHLYWQTSRYDDALKQYQAAVDLNQDVLQQELIRQRIKIDDSGRLALKDNPILDKNSGPLKVANLSVQRETRRDIQGYHANEYRYSVSGEIVNDDIRDYRNVRAEFVLYNFWGNIIDTKTLGIGTVPAGTRRAFMAVMNDFAGDERSVNRFEISLFSGNDRVGGAMGH